VHNIRPFQVLVYLFLLCLSACYSEKRESSLLEKKLKDRVEAVNKFYKDNGERFAITITSPIKTSLNLKENSAVTDTEMKFDMPGKPSTVPVRVVCAEISRRRTGKLSLSAHKNYQWRL